MQWISWMVMVKHHLKIFLWHLEPNDYAIALMNGKKSTRILINMRVLASPLKITKHFTQLVQLCHKEVTMLSTWFYLRKHDKMKILYMFVFFISIKMRKIRSQEEAHLELYKNY